MVDGCVLGEEFYFATQKKNSSPPLLHKSKSKKMQHQLTCIEEKYGKLIIDQEKIRYRRLNILLSYIRMIVEDNYHTLGLKHQTFVLHRGGSACIENNTH